MHIVFVSLSLSLSCVSISMFSLPPQLKFIEEISFSLEITTLSLSRRATLTVAMTCVEGKCVSGGGVQLVEEEK